MHKRTFLLLPFALAVAFGLALLTAVTGATPTARANGNVTLSVAHFAPFGADVDGTSVTVRVNGGDLLTEFKFPDVSTKVVVPAGTYTIEIIPTGSDTPALVSDPTELMADTEYFIAAVGGVNGYDLALYPLVIDTTPSATLAKLRVSAI